MFGCISIIGVCGLEQKLAKQQETSQSKEELHSEKVSGNILQKDTSNSAIPERNGTLTSTLSCSQTAFSSNRRKLLLIHTPPRPPTFLFTNRKIRTGNSLCDHGVWWTLIHLGRYSKVKDRNCTRPKFAYLQAHFAVWWLPREAPQHTSPFSAKLPEGRSHMQFYSPGCNEPPRSQSRS